MRRRPTAIVANIGLIIVTVIGVIALSEHRHVDAGHLDTSLVGVSQPTVAAQPTSQTVAQDPATTGESCWPVFGRDASRASDGSDLGIGIPGRQIWLKRLGSLIEFPPSVCDGVIYANTNHGQTFAIDDLTGHVLWKRRTGSGYDTTPAVAGNRLILASLDGTIAAVDRTTGAPLWQLRTGNKIESSAVVVDDVVYEASLDKRVYAINVATGRVRWAYVTGGQIKGSPAVAGGLVFIANYAGEVLALHASNGALAWNHAFRLHIAETERFYSTTAVSGGTLYVGGVGGYVYALSARSGRQEFKYRVGAYVYGTPAVAQNRICFGAFDHRIHVLSAGNGREQFSASLDGSVSGSAVIVGHACYVSTLTGTTYAYDVRSGKRLWSIHRGKYVPGIATNQRIYLSLNGSLAAFAPLPAS